MILLCIPVATLHARFIIIIIIIIYVTPVYMERMSLNGTSGTYTYDIVAYTQSIEYNTTCRFVCAQRPSASTAACTPPQSTTAIDRVYTVHIIFYIHKYYCSVCRSIRDRRLRSNLSVKYIFYCVIYALRTRHRRRSVNSYILGTYRVKLDTITHYSQTLQQQQCIIIM